MINIRELNTFIKKEFPRDMDMFHLKNYIAESLFEYVINYNQTTNSILSFLPIKLVKEWNERIETENRTNIDLVIHWGLLNNIEFMKYKDMKVVYVYKSVKYLIQIDEPIRRVRVNYGVDFYLNHFTIDVLESILSKIEEKLLLQIHQGVNSFVFDSLDVLRQYTLKLLSIKLSETNQ